MREVEGKGSRVERVERWFGIRRRKEGRVEGEVAPLPRRPRAGEIVLITGASGSGKSTLLRRYRACMPVERCLDLDAMPLPEEALVDLFEEEPLGKVLELLSRVGLAEAHSYVRRPSELSDGQRWRLRLAMAVYRARVAGAERREGEGICIVADEFGAILDRVTAAIVAHGLRRAVDQERGLCAVVASSREDLVGGLRPDVVVRCDFGWREGGR